MKLKYILGKISHSLLKIFVFIFLFSFSTSFAQVSLLSYSNVASIVTSCDDCAQQIDITGVFEHGIKFDGTIYTDDVYIGSNGYLTFGHSNTRYSPIGIAGYSDGPIIAGQYDDLNANSGGTIYYDENSSSGYIVVTFYQLEPYSSPVYGSGTVSFQIVLRKHNSYSATTPNFQIEVRYNNIGWWQSGNVSSPPTAGWSTGTGSSYEVMPYSGSSSFGSNISSSNIGTAGLYRWDVIDGVVFAAPTVNTTSDATNITRNSATSGGTISSDGNASITLSGIVWSTSSFPTLGSHPGGNYTTNGITTTGSYSSNLSGLTQGTTYYVRAYATNSKGTGYGPEITFQTLSNSPPTVINESYFVYAGTSRSVTSPNLLDNDTDPDLGDVMTITNTGVQATNLGGSVNISSTGTFSYTPAANHNPGDNDTFTYIVSDGTDSNTGTCTINIENAIFNGTEFNTNPGNWNGGYVPPLDQDMDVIFQTGVITISTSMIVRNLTIYNAASFICTGGATITVHGNVGNENRIGVTTNSPIIYSTGFKVNN